MALSLAVAAAPLGQAHAGLIPTERTIQESNLSADRQRVEEFVAREDVQKEFEKYGVKPEEAAARVAALSDEEIQKITSKMDELPAGQDAVGAVVGAAVVIFIVLLITDILCVTSVFNFTRCAR